MIRTSQMAVVTSPARFGFELVDVFFGQTRVRQDQTMAVKGDLVRQIGSDTVSVFEGREDDQITTSPMES